MTPDVAGVISLNWFLAPVDDNVTAQSTVTKSQSHKVPGSSRVPGTLSAARGGWVFHQPPWSFASGFVLEDHGLLDTTGLRHTTQPAHAGVGGHHTTVSPLFFIAYPQTRVPAPSVLGPHADATGA